MDMKWYTKLDVVWKTSLIFFRGHPSNFKVIRAKNRRFESNLSKTTRPVAAIRSLRFAFLMDGRPSGVFFKVFASETRGTTSITVYPSINQRYFYDRDISKSRATRLFYGETHDIKTQSKRYNKFIQRGRSQDSRQVSFLWIPFFLFKSRVPKLRFYPTPEKGRKGTSAPCKERW